MCFSESDPDQGRENRKAHEPFAGKGRDRQPAVMGLAFPPPLQRSTTSIESIVPAFLRLPFTATNQTKARD
jgi:hypothetical protein